MSDLKRNSIFIDQYQSLKSTYKEFADYVKSILEILLKKNGFQYHIVTPREKKTTSLKKKLKDDVKMKNVKKLIEIDDLAACRVIFFLQSDIEKFIIFIRDEFQVVKERPKDSPDNYNAYHIVVKLREERLRLIEYSKFMNLKCEIQLTTVLFHAWSEMNHRLFYKPEKEISEFDKPKFESIKKTFSEIMKKHIQQASYSFDYVFRQYEKLKQGQEIFNLIFLNRITQSDSNNEIYENLSILKEYASEFGDKTPKELDIIEIIEEILIKSKKNKRQPLKTIIGELEGRTYIDIAIICIEILDILKYYHIEKTFFILIKLSREKFEEIQRKALDVLGSLSEYNYLILKKIGYLPQQIIINILLKWNNKEIFKNFTTVIEILEHFLSTRYEGHYLTDPNTFTIKFGPVPINDHLKNIRKKSLSYLNNMYIYSRSLAKKKQILGVMQHASFLPDKNFRTKKMIEMVINDTNKVIDFFIKIIDKAPHIIVQEIENQLFSFREYLEIRKLQKIEQIQLSISSKTGYDFFRTFFPSRVTIKNENKNGISKKIEEYISDFTIQNFQNWEDRILEICHNFYSIKPDTFNYFSSFLIEISKKNPKIILRMIKDNEMKLKPFLIYLVLGVWESRDNKSAVELISEWIKDKKHIKIIVQLFELVSNIDIKLLKLFTRNLINKMDSNALIFHLGTLYKQFPNDLEVKYLFLDIITFFTKNEIYNWAILHREGPQAIIRSLTLDECDIVLNNIQNVKKITYDIEDILIPIAEKEPIKLINFFKKRVEIKTKGKPFDEFDPIPFQLHEIANILLRNKKDIIYEIFKWFNEKHVLYHINASNLLKLLFHVSDNILESKLFDLIKTKNSKNAKIVLRILNKYGGHNSVHKICKEFIKYYPLNRNNKSDLVIILSRIEPGSGKDYLIRSYKQKKKDIQEWKKDKDKKIRSFVKEYEKYLNERILYEQKRIEKEDEFIKRDFERFKNEENNK